MMKQLIKQMLGGSTYDHRSVKTGHPVRSAIHKHWTGRLVLEWVTIWESRLLYVFCFLHSHRPRSHDALRKIFVILYTGIMRHGCRDGTVSAETQYSIKSKHTARLTPESTCQ
jgi:hypothetical protein